MRPPPPPTAAPDSSLPAPPLPARRDVLAGLGVLSLGAVGFGTVTAARAQTPPLRYLVIGTGTTGGTYFPLGGILANAISSPPGSPGCQRGGGGSCGVPGLIAVAQATSGAVENVQAMRDGRYETGFVQADIAYMAVTGTGAFAGQKPLGDLVSLANLYAETIHLVARADSAIHGVHDLKGRRVALGEKGSGTLPTAQLILAAHDLRERDVVAHYLNPGTAADMMTAGDLDAFFIIGGYPLPSVADLAATLPITLVPLIDQRMAQLSRGLPLFSRTMIGGDGAYRGVPATASLAVGAQWLTTTGLDADLAYGITKALWAPTTRRLLAIGHPRGAGITPDHALDGLGVPLHPGAQRYYAEQGYDLSQVPKA